MFLLVFLLGPMVLIAATDTVTAAPEVPIDANLAGLVNDSPKTYRGKMCPRRIDTDIKLILTTSPTPIPSNVDIKLCWNETNVKSLEVFETIDTLPASCESLTFESDSPTLILPPRSIASFEQGWYQIPNLFNSINFNNNYMLAEFTSEILNDLPRNIKYVSFDYDGFQRVNKSVIVNEHLQGLDLSHDLIRMIEEDAFAKTNLTHLDLTSNRLEDLRFVASLPTTLIELSLRSNYIEEVPAGSFSHLANLLILNLQYNRIKQLSPQGLSELTSLENKGAFNGLGCLEELNLSTNELTELNEDTFHGLTINLERLTLKNNNITSTKNAFLNLNRLKSLDVTDNPLKETLNEQNFAGLPRSCEIIITGSKKSQRLTPLAFRIKENKTSVINVNIQPKTYRGKICPERVDTNIHLHLVSIPTQIPRDVFIKRCKEGTKIKSLELFDANETLSASCKEFIIEYDRPMLAFHEWGIRSFEKGWYQIPIVAFNCIYFVDTKIEEFTSEILNDLPQNIKYVSIKVSKIQSVRKGVIVNEHLQGLDLNNNEISIIDTDAFAKTKLIYLNLAINWLTDLGFVASLPATLTELDLGSNHIDNIPSGSFSHLKKLLVLNLWNNRIKEVHPQGLIGLESLQLFTLCRNRLNRLELDVFQPLGNLLSLELCQNRISRLNKGVFNGLGCLEELNLNYNQFTTCNNNTLHGLTDNLDRLRLSSNKLKSLEAGSFVNIPKQQLFIDFNEIGRIDKNAFDLPHLRRLAIFRNNIKKVVNGTFANLGLLSDGIEISLSDNPITRLENGAFAGIPDNSTVDLTSTPTKVIEAGVFDYV